MIDDEYPNILLHYYPDEDSYLRECKDYGIWLRYSFASIRAFLILMKLNSKDYPFGNEDESLKAIDKQFKLWASSGLRSFLFVENFSIQALLMAYALEQVLKAAIIAKEPQAAVKNKKFSHAHHNLSLLANNTFQTDTRETEFLETLRAIIEFYGRYPINKRLPEAFSKNKFNIKFLTPDYAMFKQIWLKAYTYILLCRQKQEGNAKALEEGKDSLFPDWIIKKHGESSDPISLIEEDVENALKKD